MCRTTGSIPREAGALLDQAGYRDPDGPGPAPRLHLTLKVSSTEFNRLQSSVLQQDFARVGVALDVRTYEFATLYADVLKGNFQLFTLQWVGVSDPDMLRRVFHTKQMPPSGFNRGFFSNAGRGRAHRRGDGRQTTTRGGAPCLPTRNGSSARRCRTSVSGTRPTSPSRGATSPACACRRRQTSCSCGV